VLKIGGILRIAVPDLELIVKWYLADREPLASHRFIDRLALGHTVQELLHPGSNHSQMFAARSLVHLLRSAGFDNPEVSRYRTSGIPEIEKIEREVRRNESLYVEARKDS
jgi:hypothetical protein